MKTDAFDWFLGFAIAILIYAAVLDFREPRKSIGPLKSEPIVTRQSDGWHVDFR